MFAYCHSLADVDCIYCISYRKFLRPDEYVELRLDMLDFDVEQVKDYFRQTKGLKTIATYYLPEDIDEELYEQDLSTAVQLLTAAVMSGASYIDLSIDFPEKERDWLITLALNYHCNLIISYHNYYGVQPKSELRAIAERCFGLGADIVKIVTTARHPDETDAVLSLYKNFPQGNLVAYSMGHYGRLSRILALEGGCPLYYIVPRQSRMLSEGQPTFYDILEDKYKKYTREVKAPCSDSYTVMSVIAAALGQGESRIRQVNLSMDITAALNVARQLGADAHYDKKKRTITIKAAQNDIAAEGLKVEDNTLNAGKSTMVADICLALATLSREPVTVTGEKSLLKKRFAGSCTPLLRHGADISFSQGRLPAVVSGRLNTGNYVIDGTRRPEAATGLLFVLPMLENSSKLVIKKATSVPQIRMTMNILEHFGYSFAAEDFSGEDISVSFHGGQALHPGKIRIESDWGGAALWIAVGVAAGETMVRKLPVESDQAGKAIADLIERSGGDLGYYASDNPRDETGDFSALRSVTFAYDYDLAETPDMIGPLMILALRSEGVSSLTGLTRIKGRSAERLRNFVKAFKSLGADIEIDDDTMRICGSFSNTLKGCKVSCYGDPLLAMALSAANLIADGEVEITDLAKTETAWPLFKS